MVQSESPIRVHQVIWEMNFPDARTIRGLGMTSSFSSGGTQCPKIQIHTNQTMLGSGIFHTQDAMVGAEIAQSV
jgi:hypothetical protein